MTKKHLGEVPDPRSSREARGLRLKSIRRSLNLSRQDFSKQFGISIYTLQNWETNKNGGLGEDRAAKVIRLLKQTGINCSFEWLVHGIGSAPVIADLTARTTPIPTTQVPITDELTFIAEELKLFREHYPQQVMDMVVMDDGMEPSYIMGDYVAGLKHFDEQIARCLGQTCIVQTQEGDILLRQIKQSTLPEHYTLVSTNPNSRVTRPILYDVKLVMAAPVVWTRRMIT